MLQIVPPSGSWKCECDSSQQAVEVSTDQQHINNHKPGSTFGQFLL